MLQVQQLQDLQGSQLGALQRKIGSGRWKTTTGSGADRRKALRKSPRSWHKILGVMALHKSGAINGSGNLVAKVIHNLTIN